MFVAPADRHEEEGDGDQARKHHVTSALHAVLFCMGSGQCDTCWTLKRWIATLDTRSRYVYLRSADLTEKAAWIIRINYR